MPRYLLLIIAMLFTLTPPATAIAEEPADTAAIAAAVKAYVTKETVENVYVEKLVLPFAAAIVTVQNGEGGTAYLQKRESGWTVILYSSVPTEDALKSGGVPADTAIKLLE